MKEEHEVLRKIQRVFDKLELPLVVKFQHPVLDYPVYGVETTRLGFRDIVEFTIDDDGTVILERPKLRKWAFLKLDEELRKQFPKFVWKA